MNITLLPGVTLRCWQDGRFKQGCISIQLVRPMCQEEAAMNALIPTVLLRATRQHPDLRSITMALDDLYGASVSPLVRRVGDYQTVGLYCGFMDQRFALPGDRVLEPIAAFLKELLLDSPTQDGGFLPELVDSEKRNLISVIESELNDKRAYAAGKLLRSMCREDTFGIPRLGDRQEVEAIDPVKLYEHYRNILRTSQIRIFYVGSAQPDTVAPLLRSIFQGLEREPMLLPAQTEFHTCPGQDAVETMDVAQGKLCMGFVTPTTLRTPEFAAMQMLNNLFGAGMTSKLFMVVREQMSLCYNIGSAYYGTKGILMVTAGIDFDKEEITRREVLHQLELCREGKFTQDELTRAREAILSGLRSIHDTPGSIENYYATTALNGLGMTPEQYMDAVNRVTPEQVVRAAQSLTLHSTYFLKGEPAHE